MGMLMILCYGRECTWSVGCLLVVLVVACMILTPSLNVCPTFRGDKQVFFADKVMKFTGSGKLKQRILLITDFAIYIVYPDTDALKRRIALEAVEKICLSELSDNFFASIILTEYDILMASTRKTEIVTVLVNAMKSTSDYEL